MNNDLYRRILAGKTAAAILSPRALWKLTGPDAERYLNGQITNDITRLTEDNAFYAAVCTAKGRMEGDVFVARHGGEFFLDASIDLRESLGARLEKYLIADDAVFEDISDLWCLSHIFGSIPSDAIAIGFAVPNKRFGLPGHDIWSPTPGAMVYGETISADLLEVIRLENGIPRWGAELTTNTLPPEAGSHMLNAISYTKGCYVGQETIARLKSVGHVNRTLVVLQDDSERFPLVGAKLMLGDKEVGVVTSSAFSPRLEKGMALGYVQRQFAQNGTKLQAEALTLTVS